MFIIFLKFSTNKSAAKQHMEGHNAWLKKGFDEGIFALSGSITSDSKGGMILAQNVSIDEIESRLADDPFVQNNVVETEINEIAPSKANDQFAFLL